MPVNHRYDKYIAEAQRKHGVPAHLLKGLIEVESGGDPGAVSYAGARGITQFMPGTAPSYGVKFGTSDAAVRTQILGAAAYLKRHGYGKPGRTKFSIAAYNGGAGNPQYGYAQKVLDATRKYKGKTNTAGVPARAGDTRTTTTKTVGSKTVELSPAVDNSAARTALLTDFLTERKKDRHKAIMNLALGSAGARDEPAVTAQVPVTKTTTTTTPQRGTAAPKGRIAANGGYTYPAAKRGSNLGGAAAHGARALGNWQSDNAVDIGLPEGTPIYAVADGVVAKFSPHANDRGQFAGDAVTLQTDRNTFFYKHLQNGRTKVKAGQRVKKGQLLGYSGFANAPHLHLGVKHGDPSKIFGIG